MARPEEARDARPGDDADREVALEPLTPLVVERLARYHRRVAERRGRMGPHPVTSAALAEAVGVDATQVRKDFALIGLRGRGRVGYDVDEVVTALRRALGFDRTHLAVLVGAGHLASALAAYRGFGKYGLRIAAAFDIDYRVVGSHLSGCPIHPLEHLPSFVAEHGIRLGIVTTPVSGARRAADVLVSSGIRAIWNFAPIRLEAPPGVFVRDEHLSLGLADLTQHLTVSAAEEARRARLLPRAPAHPVWMTPPSG